MGQCIAVMGQCIGGGINSAAAAGSTDCPWWRSSTDDKILWSVIYL